jgi:putative spermidine/putrescine transport system ATP-binding protein
MRGTSVDLVGVTKRYGQVVALDDVTLHVEPGELVALLGPSGSGKTTLLRSVAGLIIPEAGTVQIGGEDVTHVPTRRRPIGMVFQSYALFPNMSVAANIGFPLAARRRPREEIRARVRDLLALVGLEGMEDRYPNELSGGQQQRVALARALAPEPGVLLLDEPLSALDAVIRSGLRDEMRRIQQRLSITALYVTHDQSEAMAIADRIAVMADGRIVEVESPARIYEDPRERFTATFVGSRNALELPVGADGYVRWGTAFEVPAPPGANGRALAVFKPEDVELVEQGGVEGTVDVVVFNGATSRIHVAVREGLVAVDLPSRAAVGVESGRAVRLAVRTAGVRVFPA